MINRNQITKKADNSWRSILSIFSVLATVLSLVLLSSIMSIISTAGGNDFKNLYDQTSLATLLISPLLAAGYYLSKRSKADIEPDARVNSSIFHKEINIDPYIKYIVQYVFFFLLGITVLSYLLSEHVQKTNATLLTQQQIYELKQTSHYPVITYYFDIDKYDKITNVVMESGGRKVDVSRDDTDQIWRLIYKADIKPDRVVLHGYADESGIDAKNMILARRRAEFVERLFKEADFPAQLKMSVVNGGVIVSSCDQQTENRDKCLADNRRVDVYFDGYVAKKER